MNIRTKQRVTGIIIFIILGCTQVSLVGAEEKADKSSKRAAIMMQKMKQDMEAQKQQEKDALKAEMQAKFDTEKKALEQEIADKESTIKKLSSVEGKVRSLEVEQKKITSEKTTLDTKQQQTQLQLEAVSKSFEELKLKYNQALIDLKANETQRKTQLANLASTSKSLGSCEEKNAKLHEYGSNLIKFYESPDALSAEKNKTAFFKNKQIELENILQNQQDKLDAERLSVN